MSTNIAWQSKALTSFTRWWNTDSVSALGVWNNTIMKLYLLGNAIIGTNGTCACVILLFVVKSSKVVKKIQKWQIAPRATLIPYRRRITCCRFVFPHACTETSEFSYFKCSFGGCYPASHITYLSCRRGGTVRTASGEGSLSWNL